MVTRRNGMKSGKCLLSLVFVGCVAIGLAAGCGNGEPQAPTQAAKLLPPPPQPAPKAAVAKPKSIREQLETTAELVASYPEDAPIYPGARLSSSSVRGPAVNAVFSTSDSAADVVSWMREFMTSNGWQILPDADLPGGTLLQAAKGSRSLSTVISEVNDDGSLTMMIVAVAP